MGILQKLKLDNLQQGLLEVIRRFPLSFMFANITALLFISLVMFEHSLSQVSEEIIGKWIITTILSFFFATSMTLVGENLKWKDSKKYFLQIITLVFGGLFYLFFRSFHDGDMELFLYITLSTTGVLSLLLIAPFIKKILQNFYNQESYYHYFYILTGTFLKSTIVGGSLTLGGFIGIGAIFALFDLNFLNEGNYFAYWAILSLSLVAPLYGLFQLPKEKEIEHIKHEENKFFTFLVKYIGIPFIYLYFIILYAYSIKVLANFGDWPRGEVSWMVIGFSTFGYIIYILSYIFEKENSFISSFRKYFPYAVLPQIIMLGYAIYLRIHQYDLTINRYFVVVFGLWLLIISLYYILSKKKFLGMIPALLALFVLLVSIGPWSAYNYPESRQYNRLITNLENSQILQDGKILPLETYSDIDVDLSHEIYSGIDYLCDFSRCQSLRILFHDQIQLIEATEEKQFEINRKIDLKEARNNKNEVWEQQVLKRKYDGASRWVLKSEISKYIKVQQKPYGQGGQQQKFINFFLNHSISHYPIDVSGYDMILTLGQREKQANLTAEIHNSTLSLKSGEQTLESFPIHDLYAQLLDKYGVSQSEVQDPLDMSYAFSGQNYDIKLLISSISVANPDYVDSNNQNNNYINQYSDGLILIKKK